MCNPSAVLEFPEVVAIPAKRTLFSTFNATQLLVTIRSAEKACLHGAVDHRTFVGRGFADNPQDPSGDTYYLVSVVKWRGTVLAVQKLRKDLSKSSRGNDVNNTVVFISNMKSRSSP
ncbi:hypothetical protein ACFL6C_09190 [Myxococcota bacterium]